MSQQKHLLREIAAATSSDPPDCISDWFTEDFRLHEPGKPALPVGHEGPRQMREAGRQMRAGLKTPINVEILDMVEEDDRVAVRWLLPQPTTTANLLNDRSWQSIVLRTDASLRIGASRTGHFGLEALVADSSH